MTTVLARARDFARTTGMAPAAGQQKRRLSKRVLLGASLSYVRWVVRVQRFKPPLVEVSGLDEFEHHLRVAAGERGYSLAVETRSEDGFPMRDCHRLEGGDELISAELWIERSRDPRWSLAYPDAPNAEWRLWRAVVDDAAVRVGASNQAVEWECLLGTRFDELPFNINTYVAEQGTFGGVGVACADTVMSEVIYQPLPGGVGLRSHTRSFWPLALSGAVQTYDWIWDAGAVQAAEKVHEVMAFLAWLWRLPLRVVRGPGLPGVTFAGDPSSLIPVQYLGDAKNYPLNFPAWAGEAFDSAASSDRLSAALAMHCEALNLEQDHPSWAATAYVAAVESIGLNQASAEGEVRQRYLDAARRLGADEAGVRLARRLYDDVRSTTVHQAALHGSEQRSRVEGWPRSWSSSASWRAFEFTRGHLAFARLLSEVTLLTELSVDDQPERWRI